MPILCVYRDIGDEAPWSQERLIAEAPSKFRASRIIRLVTLSEGWVCAGSCARWQEASWAVRFNEDGSLHGRQFGSLDDARATFLTWTGGGASEAEFGDAFVQRTG